MKRLQLAAFTSWGDGLFPPKRAVMQTEHGRVDVSLLDLVSNREGAVRRAGHGHGTDHDHDHDHEAPSDVVCDTRRPFVLQSHRSPVASTIGWVCWNGLVFDADRVHQFVDKLGRLSGARRVKAVLRTDSGWWGFNIADGAESMRRSGYRRDSRLEVVLEGNAFPDEQALDEELRGCLASPQADDR